MAPGARQTPLKPDPTHLPPGFDLSEVGGRRRDRPDGNSSPCCSREAHYGYLPEPVVDEIARLSGVPASRILRPSHFYAQFSTEPSGPAQGLRLPRHPCTWRVPGGSPRPSPGARRADGGTTPNEFSRSTRWPGMGRLFAGAGHAHRHRHLGNLTPDSTRKSILEVLEGARTQRPPTSRGRQRSAGRAAAAPSSDAAAAATGDAGDAGKDGNHEWTRDRRRACASGCAAANGKAPRAGLRRTACVFAGSLKSSRLSRPRCAAGLAEAGRGGHHRLPGLCSQGTRWRSSPGRDLLPQTQGQARRAHRQGASGRRRDRRGPALRRPGSGERIACWHDIPFYAQQDAHRAARRRHHPPRAP